MAPDNWVHVNPEILKAGRVKHWVPASLTEDQASEAMAKLEAEDPVPPRLGSIKEDKPAPQSQAESAWRARKYGDSQPFNDIHEEGKQAFYGVVVLENDYWPGARTVLVPALQTWSFLYVGLGTASRSSPSSPATSSRTPKTPKTSPSQTRRTRQAKSSRATPTRRSTARTINRGLA